MKAYELVEKGHCKGVLARDKNGESCDRLSENAVSFCIIGAMSRVYENEVTYDLMERIEKVKEKIKVKSVSDIFVFNDNSSQKTVVELLKELDL